MVVNNSEESNFDNNRTFFSGVDVKYTKVVLRGFIRLKSVLYPEHSKNPVSTGGDFAFSPLVTPHP